MNPNKTAGGFTLVELLVSMLIVSILGGAVFVTFAQGIRLWQATVNEGAQGEEEFFFENLRSELRNAFIYGKMALNGQPDLLEFHTLMLPPRSAQTQEAARKIPAMVRYRYVPAQKAVQKEVTYYEKMLNSQSKAFEVKMVLEAVSELRFEYDGRRKQGSSSVWTSRWKDTCFPGAVKILMDSRSGGVTKEVRVISLPAEGECFESEDEAV